jgi:hypothetical protein
MVGVEKLFFNKVRKYSEYRGTEYYCVTLPKELDKYYQNQMVIVKQDDDGNIILSLSGTNNVFEGK